MQVKYGYKVEQIEEYPGIHYWTVSEVVSIRETRRDRCFIPFREYNCDPG